MSAKMQNWIMPAEWSPHLATWISWPHNEDTWPGVLEAAELAMVEVVAALAPHEHVHINVQGDDHARHVERRLAGRVPEQRVRLERIATDDAWIRDYGAIIVHAATDPAEVRAVDFDYNAWGGKYPPYDRDRAVGGQMAARLDLPRLAAGPVIEGGSVDVNGAGLGLVTEQCLLNPNRNPTMSRAEIESCLDRFLGLGELVWLGSGLDGDDTDGHVDNLARFVDRHRVVFVTCTDRRDPNHEALAENRRRLGAFRDAGGHSLELVELPLPRAVVHDGARLPASYANFYIANDIVLVPSYGGPEDATAAGVLADCFPQRSVLAIDCRALVVGLGALHCLTQQIPVMVRASSTQE